MMKKLLLVTLVLVLLSGILLMGCSSSPATTPPKTSTTSVTPTSTAPTQPATQVGSGGKTWKLRFGFEQATTSYYYMYLYEPWAKEIEKVTNGRVTIEMYPSQTLMKSTDALDAVKTGIADMGMIIPAYFPGKFPVLDVIQLPFGASTSSGASAIAWSLYEKFPEIKQPFADYKVVSMWTTEPMYFHGTKKNYKTLDDFKGQQIRASAGAATDMVNNLGANAVFFGMGDAYLNLQKGVVDAVVTPSEGAMGFRIYEVAPYLTHIPGPAAIHMIVMNKKIWNEMPADIQQAIDSVSLGIMSKKAGEVNDKARADMATKCKDAGYTLYEYTVPTDELAKWVEKAGKPMREAWLNSMKEKGVANAQAILDEVIRLAAQYK